MAFKTANYLITGCLLGNFTSKRGLNCVNGSQSKWEETNNMKPGCFCLFGFASCEPDVTHLTCDLFRSYFHDCWFFPHHPCCNHSSCFVLRCHLKPQLLPKQLEHSSHANCFGCRWTALWCIKRFLLAANALAQLRQTYILSMLCTVRAWFSRLFFVLKVLLQSLQANSRIAMCTEETCVPKFAWEENVTSHSRHSDLPVLM